MIIKLNNKRYVNLYGRVYKLSNEYYFYNSNSSLEFNILGTYFSIEYKAFCSIGNNKIKIYVDDKEYKLDLKNTNAFNKVILVNSLKLSKHHIKIVKLLEDQYSRIIIKNIESEKFLKVNSKPKLKIEYYGDSLTCGYGILGHDDNINSDNEDSSLSFAYLSSKELDADANFCCYSGIGVSFRTYFNKTMPEVYNYYSNSSKIKYDNKKFKADIIVFYLCTNDQYEIKDHPEKIEIFKKELPQFINTIRSYNKKAKIIMCYGLCDILKVVDEAVINTANSLDNVYVCKFEPNDIASVGHPGANANYNASKVLVKLIKKLIK